MIPAQAVEAAQKERPAVSAAGLEIPLGSEYPKHTMIPAEAVEAAAKAYCEQQACLGYPKWEDLPEDGREWRQDFMRIALEAAAPNMLELAWDEAYGKGFEAARGERDTPNPYEEEAK